MSHTADSTNHVQAIEVSFVPTRRESVHTVTLDGEAVLLDEENDKLHLLNESATLVWLCFDGITTVREIATDVSDELGLDPAAVLQDTVAVTSELLAEGLLQNHGR